MQVPSMDEIVHPLSAVMVSLRQLIVIGRKPHPVYQDDRLDAPQTAPARCRDVERLNLHLLSVCPYCPLESQWPSRSIRYASRVAQVPMEKAKQARQAWKPSITQNPLRTVSMSPRIVHLRRSAHICMLSEATEKMKTVFTFAFL